MTELEKTQEEFITYLLSILTPECKTIYKAIKIDYFICKIKSLSNFTFKNTRDD